MTMTETNTSETPWPELDAVQNSVTLSKEELKERGRKNLVVGAALLAFVALVFFATMAKLATNFGV